MTSILTRRNLLALGGAATLMAHRGLRAAASQGELRDDIAIVRGVLALHPGLYRYQSPGTVIARLNQLERDYAAARSLDSRFLLLSAFMAKIRCGHSQCNPYNQRKTVAQALFDRRTRLPFEFDWIDRRMILLADRSGQGLPPGTEVRAIDGLPASRLLERLLPYARADGGNDGKRIAQMAMRATESIETFDIFQGLIAAPAGNAFRIDYRTPDGRNARGDFTPLTLAERHATRRTFETDGAADPFWTWEMRDGVAILTMPSWTMYNSKWDWKSWLDERLASLKGAKGLVVDLRENEGGNECGNVILSRLAGRDLVFDGYRQLVRYRRTPADLDRYLETWDKSFRTIGEKGVDLSNGFYELGVEDTDTIAATGPRLDVPVAALIGPICSSATFSFARRCSESRLVKLFGTTSGGNLRGINGNGYFFVTLPGSGIEFDVPIVGNFPRRPRPDRGVRPDVEVPRSAADIATGRDPAMLAATRWVEAN